MSEEDSRSTSQTSAADRLEGANNWKQVCPSKQCSVGCFFCKVCIYLFKQQLPTWVQDMCFEEDFEGKERHSDADPSNTSMIRGTRDHTPSVHQGTVVAADKGTSTTSPHELQPNALEEDEEEIVDKSSQHNGKRPQRERAGKSEPTDHPAWLVDVFLEIWIQQVQQKEEVGGTGRESGVVDGEDNDVDGSGDENDSALRALSIEEMLRRPIDPESPRWYFLRVRNVEHLRDYRVRHHCWTIVRQEIYEQLKSSKNKNNIYAFHNAAVLSFFLHEVELAFRMIHLLIDTVFHPTLLKTIAYFYIQTNQLYNAASVLHRVLERQEESDWHAIYLSMRLLSKIMDQQIAKIRETQLSTPRHERLAQLISSSSSPTLSQEDTRKKHQYSTSTQQSSSFMNSIAKFLGISTETQEVDGSMKVSNQQLKPSSVNNHHETTSEDESSLDLKEMFVFRKSIMECASIYNADNHLYKLWLLYWNQQQQQHQRILDIKPQPVMEEMLPEEATESTLEFLKQVITERKPTTTTTNQVQPKHLQHSQQLVKPHLSLLEWLRSFFSFKNLWQMLAITAATVGFGMMWRFVQHYLLVGRGRTVSTSAQSTVLLTPQQSFAESPGKHLATSSHVSTLPAHSVSLLSHNIKSPFNDDDDDEREQNDKRVTPVKSIIKPFQFDEEQEKSGNKIERVITKDWDYVDQMYKDILHQSNAHLKKNEVNKTAGDQLESLPKHLPLIESGNNDNLMGQQPSHMPSQMVSMKEVPSMLGSGNNFEMSEKPLRATNTPLSQSTNRRPIRANFNAMRNRNRITTSNGPRVRI